MRKSKQLKVKNEYLKLIYMIGFDYDGCDTVESLKELIDTLVDYAAKAFNNDIESCIYGSEEEEFNILMERINKGKKVK